MGLLNDPRILAAVFQHGGALLTEAIRNGVFKRVKVEQTEAVTIEQTKVAPQEIKKASSNSPYKVSDAATIAYQDRELGKALLLMEIHLQQRCKIDGTPCDCCEKHPMVIEALSEEALGMTGDPQYSVVTAWAKKVSPQTTTAASASGKYDESYPKLAQEARLLRKKIMGTEDVSALVTSKERAQMVEQAVKMVQKEE